MLVHEQLRNFRPFWNSRKTFWGMRGQGYVGLLLPENWVRQYLENSPRYTVYSYSTPIGWFSKYGAWVVPEVKYCAAVSRHQSWLRSSIPPVGRYVL